MWPYWVERQYDPSDDSFIPRAFSITHVNLTHRNRTAVGVSDCVELPVVDPRGLVTPFWDGWSLDAWVFGNDGTKLMPSHRREAHQELDLTSGLAVVTATASDGLSLRTGAQVDAGRSGSALYLEASGAAAHGGWLVVALPGAAAAVSSACAGRLSIQRRSAA